MFAVACRLFQIYIFFFSIQINELAHIFNGWMYYMICKSVRVCLCLCNVPVQQATVLGMFVAPCETAQKRQQKAHLVCGAALLISYGNLLHPVKP